MPNDFVDTRPNRMSFRAARGICFSRCLTLCLVASFSCCAVIAQNSPARPRIEGIMLVRIGSSNRAAAARFYKQLVPRARVVGESYLILGTGQEIEVEDLKPGDPFLQELWFITSSLPRLSDYLTSHSVEVHEERMKGDLVRLHVADPEGHKIVFADVDLKKLQSRDRPVEPVRVPHIIHAGFIVRDRAATEHFYKDILGFRPYWHGGMKDDRTDWISLQVPDGTDWVELMVNVSPDADQRVRGIMNHMALGVPDIHEAQKQLLMNGVHLTEEPKIGRDGKWQLNVYDPDQTRIEFMEFTPKEEPCCSEFTGPHPKP